MNILARFFEPILPYDDLEDEDVDELLGWLETGDKQAPNESTYLIEQRGVQLCVK